MPAQPISYGDLHFAKKGDAVAHLNAMLQKYDVGDKVSAADGEVLLAALAHHPDGKEKFGCGVAGFSVRSADFGTKCFWVNRTDGSTEKFSHRACVQIEPTFPYRGPKRGLSGLSDIADVDPNLRRRA